MIQGGFGKSGYPYSGWNGNLKVTVTPMGKGAKRNISWVNLRIIDYRHMSLQGQNAQKKVPALLRNLSGMMKLSYIAKTAKKTVKKTAKKTAKKAVKKSHK